ncbi:FtsX-like permease family protein [Cellulomonas sp. KRMCY2]|uniref:FtsX-like permease family protein n=1 Tax=Cellulomonas sp. KRMCY2 TaxID=1304865 RepID=UPI00045E96C7|nr:FtsX-like permease family protein [Cellulomonas sp. KRMCY2]
MLRLGTRLWWGSGMSGFLAGALVAFAIALGLGVTIVGLGVGPAIQERADRVAWTTLDMPELTAGIPASLTVARSPSYVGTHRITVMTVAGDDDAPVPPGIGALPAAGQAYLSPAVTDLLEQTPQAIGRFGTVVGTIDDEGLRGPGDLLVVRGAPVEQVALSGVTVDHIADRGLLPALSGVERLTFTVGAVALIAPVLLLVAIAVQLNATTRRRRRDILDLAGATPRQLTSIAVGEMAVPVLSGVLLAVPAAHALRGLAASVSLDGAAFFVDDLIIATPALVAVCVLALILCLGAVAVGARAIVPGTAAPRAAGAHRRWGRGVASMSAAAIAIASVLMGADRSPALAVVTFVGTLIVLVLATPRILGYVGRTLEAAPGAAALLAGRRIRDNPRAGVRASAGLGLALMITAMFAAITPAAAATLDRSAQVGQAEGTAQAVIQYVSPQDASSLAETIDDRAGIDGATLVITAQVSAPQGAYRAWIGNCSAIITLARLDDADCTTGMVAGRDVTAALRDPSTLELYDLAPAQVRAWDAIPEQGDPDIAMLHDDARWSVMASQPGIDMPDIVIDPTLVDLDPAAVRPTLLVFAYDSAEALEGARTVIEQSSPHATVATRATTFDGLSLDVRRLYTAVNIGAATLALVCGAALLASTAATVIERRRSLTTLRIAGAPLRTLRTSIMIEGLAPLVMLATLSAGAGIALGLLLAEGHSYPLRGVALPLLGSITAGALVVAASALLVEPLTRTEQTRTE